MSKKWSSFSEQQLLTENWRKFLTEEEVQTEEIEEGFLGRIGTAAKAGAKAARKSWDETRPKPMEDYPATELATILNMVFEVASLSGDDRDEIVKEFEDMLKAQNFVIKERSEQLIFAKKPVLDLEKMPTLNGVLSKIEKDNPDAHKTIMSAFQRGGFKIGDTPSAQQTAAQQSQPQDDIELPEPEPQAQAAAPAEEPEQPIIEPRSPMDRAAEISGYPAPGEPEEIPTGDKAKQEPPEIKDEVPDAQDQDSSAEELTPEQKASNEIKNILKKDFESEAFKTTFPEFADYDFDQQYAAFISDLRALVSKINELSRSNMASGLGVDVKDINALAKKYPPIFKLIGRFRPSAQEQKMFLSDLLNVARGTPKKAEKDLSPDETPTVIKTPKKPEKEETVEIPENFPIGFYDVLDLVGIEDRKSKEVNALRRAYKKGLNGARMSLKYDYTEGIIKLKTDGSFKTGNPNKDALGDQTRFRRDAEEHINKLYSEITKEPRNRLITSNTVNAVKAYIAGVLKSFETRVFEEQETLNESTMLRWKQLAGIL